jgi:hypothetical protein
MIETFTSAGWRDFNQRYSGVFGFFPAESGKEILVYMDKVTDSKCSFRDANELTYYAAADEGVNFKFIPITKRVFMFNGMPCLAQRVPARQYRRGICCENTHIRAIPTRATIKIDFDSVAAYVSKVDVALFPTTRIYDDMFSRYGNSVYLYETIVADFVTSSGKQVVMHNELFKQELIDCFRRNNIEVEFV